MIQTSVSKFSGPSMRQADRHYACEALRLAVLTKSTPWYGQRSGYYEQLPKYLDPMRIVAPRDNFANRALGRIWSMARGMPRRNQSLTTAELSFRRAMRRADAGLVLAVEEHLPLLSYWKKAPTNLVATIHFPRALWREDQLEQLRRLSSAIVLYRADCEFFESHLGAGRVRFVPHGVDTEFFSPDGESTRKEKPRLFFAGQFERDFAMLGRVLRRLRSLRPELLVDLLIPQHVIDRAEVKEVLALPGIRHHARLSDEQLLALYRSSTLMLLPMKESGANNAIVEALSCGLPIVTNAVGGIRDYGGGTLYPVCDRHDDDGMVSLVLRHLDEPEWRRSVSERIRQFALRELTWPHVARQHREAVCELAGFPAKG